MDPAMDGKSLEKRLKVAALACAATLTPPTGYEPPEPPPPEDDGPKIRLWHERKQNENKAK